MTKNICTVRILDEVNCVLTGLHPDHLGFFYETFGIHVPGYFFNPRFKLGTWDGKIRYFHKTGKTFVNLLPEIIPKVIGLGYKVKLDDTRDIPPVSVPNITSTFLADRGVKDPDTGEPWMMRDYQVDMVNSLIDNNGGIGIAATGAGKTSMTAVLAKAYEEAAGFRSIIIVPDKNLTDQTKTEYAFFGLDVGEYSGDCKDIQHQHIVSTWQSLKNTPNLIQSFDLVIVDECQGLRGPVLSKLLNDYGKNVPYRFGVTGTLPKEPADALAVRVAVGDVQYTIPAHVLIEQGHLATLQIDVLQMKFDFNKQYEEYLKDIAGNKPVTYQQFKNSYFPDWSSEKNHAQTSKPALKFVSEYIELKRSEPKGNVLCLVNGINYGKKLAKQIDGAVFLHGKDPVEDRKKIYDLFKTNDNMVVIATANIASTGLNIKRIFNLIFINVGKSFIRVIQSIGRGLRKAPDKTHVHVSDICTDLKYGKKHLTERKKYYREARYPFKDVPIDLRDYT